MKRRDFLVSAAAATGAAASGAPVGKAWAQGQGNNRAKLDRIAIMSYSFGPIVKSLAEPDNPARTLDPMDIPQMYADRFGIHNIEMQHSHFHSTEASYLREFLNRVQKVGSRITQVNVEFGNLNMSATNPVNRLETIDLTKRWVDHCVMLGCPRLMLNQGTLAPEVRPHAIEALRLMARYGDSRSVWVTLENRGAAGWQLVEEVVKAAGTTTTPDMGNFANQEEQLAGIRALFPMHSGNAHVKLRPERYDLPRAIALTKQLGYNGIYSIETTSNVHPDVMVGTKMILDVLLEHI
ncbi:MAG: sugar phosphate isomerase/epimerase [Gemmatimonadetes bacterium]|nr:sugar phosphate isomerase/epimerase [Gemmatimonadota bacterium]